MSEKTEPPSGKKLAEARSEGRVARSQELNTAAALLMSVYLLRGPGARLVEDLKNILASSIMNMPYAEPDPKWVENYLISNVLRVLPDMGTIVIGMMATGVIVTVAQTGLMWAKKRIGFNFDRLNFLKGFKRFFSLDQVVELAKAIVKLLVVGWVAYAFLQSQVTEMLTLAQMEFGAAMAKWVDLAMTLAWRIGSTYLVIAVLDYAYQRWQWMKSMRMSKEELKEEFKSQEGDPKIRSRIKAQQRRIMRMRMMANVPKADVVITNPTHLAVAIEYKVDEMNAPKVIAKGADNIAQKIIEIARANNVPVVQNIPVARALFHNVEIEAEIPPAMYAALAEVLAYVYRLRHPAPVAA